MLLKYVIIEYYLQYQMVWMILNHVVGSNGVYIAMSDSNVNLIEAVIYGVSYQWVMLTILHNTRLHDIRVTR